MSSNIIRQVRRPSIRDVAKAASVSTSTVSLVLNRHASVSPVTRRIVEAAMARLGYRPRAAGRPIIRGRGQTILLIYSRGAIHSRKLSPLAQAWTEGVCLTLSSHGVRLCSMAFDVAPINRDAMAMIQRDIDGAIAVGNVEQTHVLDALLRLRVPLVAINGQPRYGEYGYVSIDNYGSMRMAVDYLASLGHRRIAWVGTPGDNSFVRARNKGVADACAYLGVDLVYDQPYDAVAHPEQIDDICRGVLDSGATALCTGDYTAVPIIDRWHQCNVEVPRDISVLGYDDMGFRTFDDRRVTTIGFDKFHMGELAAEAMLEILQNKQMLSTRSAHLATRIVSGETTRAIDKKNNAERITS